MRAARHSPLTRAGGGVGVAPLSASGFTPAASSYELDEARKRLQYAIIISFRAAPDRRLLLNLLSMLSPDLSIEFNPTSEIS
ncbi:MAG TPA: hypothetical protein VF656_07195 [Pyrinomonadaceae bacterium]|jgi:hypothetical protein